MLIFLEKKNHMLHVRAAIERPFPKRLMKSGLTMSLLKALRS